MTKKKRRRKEQHHQRGNPPPTKPDTTDLETMALEDPIVGDFIDGPAATDPYPLQGSGDIRAYDRGLLRILHFLDKHGIVPSGDTEQQVEELVAANPQVIHEDIPGPRTALQHAQDLMYDAFANGDPDERVRLANLALDRSKNCADAYVVLAEEEMGSMQAAKRLYEQGVKAGERAYKHLDLEAIGDDTWKQIEVRPYYRALFGLANTCALLGEIDEALVHYRRLASIDPLDYQGARYSHANALLHEDRDDELEALLDRFANDTTEVWAYTRALLTFRREGGSEQANKTLDHALEINDRVPLYLLGLHQVSADLLGTSFGADETRMALEYHVTHSSFWLRTPNAIEWLRGRADGEDLRRLASEPQRNWREDAVKAMSNYRQSP